MGLECWSKGRNWLRKSDVFLTTSSFLPNYIMDSHPTTQLSYASLMYLYPCKSLKPSNTAVLKRLTQTPLNKISLTLSHQIAPSPITITTFVLSLTSTPLSAVAHSVRGSRHPGSKVSRSSSASWKGSVGRQRDVGSSLNSPSTNKFTTPLNRKLQT